MVTSFNIKRCHQDTVALVAYLTAKYAKIIRHAILAMMDFTLTHSIKNVTAAHHYPTAPNAYLMANALLVLANNTISMLESVSAAVLLIITAYSVSAQMNVLPALLNTI
jgi:hypothetical protein